jgi:hypothetical protein
MKKWRNYNYIFVVASTVIFLFSCFPHHSNPYENLSANDQKNLKQVILPLSAGTDFLISQGAFGKASHNEPGNQYSWDFDVPYGTQVRAVLPGKIIEIWSPGQSGGCDAKYSDAAHNIKIEHDDGTVAQYVHVDTKLRLGDKVQQGQVIAVTAMNGWICSPQLHFGIYKSRNHLYNSTNRATIPLLFQGLPNGGIAKEGYKGRVPFIADPSKVRPWSIKLSQEEPAKYPYLAHYQFGSKNLFYIAAHHSNSTKSPTFKMIDKILTNYSVQAVLLEGFFHSYGINPKRMIDYAMKDGKDGYFRGGEPIFSIQRSVAGKVNFTGGEPDEKVIMKAVLDKRYTLEDLFGFYFVRQVPEFKEDPSLDHKNPEALYKRFESGMAHTLSISEENIPSFAEFKRWYQKGNKVRFSFTKIDSEVPAPLGDGKLLTQRVSAVVDEIRNAYIVSVIAELLNKFDNILVVYGGSHLASQQLAIEEMLGTPIKIETQL